MVGYNTEVMSSLNYIFAKLRLQNIVDVGFTSKPKLNKLLFGKQEGSVVCYIYFHYELLNSTVEIRPIFYEKYCSQVYWVPIS